MAVLLGKMESESIPLDEKQPHTWMVSGCFTVGTMRDSWNRSPFLSASFQTSFQTRQKVGRGLHQRSRLCTSLSTIQSLYFPQNPSRSRTFFLVRSGFFATLLEAKAIVQKSTPHCARSTLTPACYQSSASSSPLTTRFCIALAQQDSLGQPKAFLTCLLEALYNSIDGSLRFHEFEKQFPRTLVQGNACCTIFFGANHCRKGHNFQEL